MINNGSEYHNVSRFITPETFPVPGCDQDIVLTGYHYQQAHYQDALFTTLNIPFPATLHQAVIKRRAEYLAGRFAASQALAKLGIYTRDIPTGTHRSPCWPSGILASITHTSSAAFCVAAHQKNVNYLGIDHENWLSLKSVNDIKSSIINSAEESLLRQSSLTFEQVFTLVFSAKESLFKALYPSVGYYFDFSAAEITEINIPEKSFNLRLTQTLTPALTAGACFNGKFIFDDSAIQTLIHG